MATLNVGDRAPDFTIPMTMEDTWTLSDHLGVKNIVVLFFPLAYSPPCHAEMCSFRDGFSEFKGLDAHVVAISVDNPFVLTKWKDELKLPFQLLSDFNREVGPAWGAFHEELGPLKGVDKRAAFVIDKKGIIRYAWVSDDPGVMPDPGEIRKALDSLS
ncbi:MAG: redoxin domain-containing protein [Candidatus Krumholzibacteriota bacterium]|nr:redoxin domain-containing protein [Candidatus Krumholzibacteriota bacterium]